MAKAINKSTIGLIVSELKKEISYPEIDIVIQFGEGYLLGKIHELLARLRSADLAGADVRKYYEQLARYAIYGVAQCLDKEKASE
jgi:hypothetical protein